MKDIKEQLIRLGAQQPELQKHIRPVLATMSKESGMNLDSLMVEAIQSIFKAVIPTLKRVDPSGTTYKVGRDGVMEVSYPSGGGDYWYHIWVDKNQFGGLSCHRYAGPWGPMRDDENLVKLRQISPEWVAMKIKMFTQQPD